MQAAQDSLKGRLLTSQGKASKEIMRELALEHARSSIALLSDKATPEEINAYRKLLYGLAEKWWPMPHEKVDSWVLAVKQ
jgi:hypothetical protein